MFYLTLTFAEFEVAEDLFATIIQNVLISLRFLEAKIK